MRPEMPARSVKKAFVTQTRLCDEYGYTKSNAKILAILDKSVAFLETRIAPISGQDHATQGLFQKAIKIARCFNEPNSRREQSSATPSRSGSQPAIRAYRGMRRSSPQA